jgi:hypothetical protein
VFPVWWTRSSESARSLVAHRVVAWRSVGRLCPGKINLRSQTLLFRSGRWKAPASSHFEAMQPARAGEPWRAVAATIWRCAMRRPPGSSISHGAHSEIPPPSCKHDGHGEGSASQPQPARKNGSRQVPGSASCHDSDDDDDDDDDTCTRPCRGRGLALSWGTRGRLLCCALAANLYRSPEGRLAAGHGWACEPRREWALPRGPRRQPLARGLSTTSSSAAVARSGRQRATHGTKVVSRSLSAACRARGQLSSVTTRRCVSTGPWSIKRR